MSNSNDTRALQAGREQLAGDIDGSARLAEMKLSGAAARTPEDGTAAAAGFATGSLFSRR